MSLSVAACGDPCLDDGLGKGECLSTSSNADEVGSEETSDETADETAEGTMDETETGTADQGSTETGEAETYCADDDMDGYGDPEDCEEVPAGEDPPAGSVPQSNGEDCDDDDANTFPGAAPNDDPEACMTDADGDDFGDEMPSNSNAVPGSDCNDTSENTFPGAAPNDDPDACMQDEDDDDYGDSSPVGTTIPGTDCNDTNPEVFNCTLWCEDADQDGVGGQNCVEVSPGEEPPEGYVEGDNDCLDDNPDVYPGAAEQEPELCTADIDDDGYGDMNAEMTYPGSQNGTDCDDSSATAFPGAAEIDDPNACMEDADDDGWGESSPIEGVAPGNDCDDSDSARVVCPDAVPGCVDTTLGGSAQLMATAVGGDGNYTYEWTPADTLNDAFIPDPEAMPTDITTYTVTATDGLGNQGTDDLTVHITDKSWILGGVPEAECEAVGFLGAPATHTFSADGTTTCTTSNSDPTAYICPIVHESVRITGTMEVQTTDDDDIIGFVWGWQSADQFYMLSWKKTYQNWFGCDGLPGITVKLVDRQEDWTNTDFACGTDTPNVSVLMEPQDTTTNGWISNRVYDVEVLYDTTQTEITITDTSNAMVVANFVVADGTYPSGQFGTYDFSQVSACNGPWQSSCL
ncbi:hypothetical protein PPSIR1_27618 [Plesiocystis pacifica SIR-1]|uniref:TSP C-terminal domain-containing protein n=1 Tax=Plesiocystis pacifica SIR-1 TaxID=391625 RepID=A6GEF2_9BACT|nr:hypothetical protein [Plesiocystis pacifica]EDM75724.1 hypothetical protein PPSIR1_27618 [Plesiocystis pacifica SIR-1]